MMQRHFIIIRLLSVIFVISPLQGQYVAMEANNGHTYKGKIRLAGSVTVLLIAASGDSLHLNQEGIAFLYLPRTSNLKTVVWGTGTGLALGGFAGLVQPIGTEVDFTRSERVLAYGLGAAALGALITGSIAALKSIDVDVPWQRLSAEQQRSILSQLASGTYRYGWHVRAAPWLGSLKVATTGSQENEASTMAGARLRLHLKPRAGLELAFARSDWYDVRWPLRELKPISSRARADYFSFTTFLAFTYNRLLNSFLSWGFALVKEKSETIWPTETASGEMAEERSSGTNNFLPFQMQAGLEIPIMRWLSLEGRGVFISYFWQQNSYLGYQVGINFGPKF